jgi:hypothetical protein
MAQAKDNLCLKPYFSIVLFSGRKLKLLGWVYTNSSYYLELVELSMTLNKKSAVIKLRFALCRLNCFVMSLFLDSFSLYQSHCWRLFSSNRSRYNAATAAGRAGYGAREPDMGSVHLQPFRQAIHCQVNGLIIYESSPYAWKTFSFGHCQSYRNN